MALGHMGWLGWFGGGFGHPLWFRATPIQSRGWLATSILARWGWPWPKGVASHFPNGKANFFFKLFLLNLIDFFNIFNF
jgi:hypothetical protein